MIGAGGDVAGHGHGCSAASAVSTAARFALDDRTRPACRRPPDDAPLMAGDGVVARQEPDSAKKHGCMTVLIRPPRPASRATRWASMTCRVEPLSRICSCTSTGRCVPRLVGGYGLLSRNVAPGSARREHVDPIEEAELVTGDEVGARRSGRSSRSVAGEAQMRDRHRARLLRVVDEVALRVEVGVLADDLHRVLVGADGAVRAESVEHGPDGARDRWRTPGRPARLSVRDVVDDADGEAAAAVLGAPSSSNTALTIAGVNSFDARPYRPPMTRGDRASPPVPPRRPAPATTSRYSGSAAAPGSLVRSSTATRAHGRRQRREQGARPGTAGTGGPVSRPTRSPAATSASTVSRAAPAPEPMSTIDPLGVGRAVVVDEVVAPAGAARPSSVHRRPARCRAPRRRTGCPPRGPGRRRRGSARCRAAPAGRGRGHASRWSSDAVLVDQRREVVVVEQVDPC